MTREDAINLLSQFRKDGEGFLCDNTIEAFKMAIKALEQEPCEDEYIKVPKKALKYRTAGMVAYNAEWLKNNFDIERAVICGAQEPCEDVIGRSDMLDAIGHGTTYTSEELQKIIKALPSVNPQPKTGHWEWVQYDYNPKLGNWHCSECRSVVIECVDKNDKGGIPLYKYCPQCGAKMQEVEE